jgi:TonB family protein
MPTSPLMAEPIPLRANDDNGHLAVHVDGLHAPDLIFSFEHRQSRVGVGAAFGTHVLFAIIAILIATYAPAPGVGGPIAPTQLPKEIVWLSEPGPGGGGGGGGNQMPDPPKKAELPGKEKISVPVERPPAPKPPQEKFEEPKEPLLNIPAKTLGDAQQLSPGVLDNALPVAMLSQGSGAGGGAGRGEGTGIGPGKGSGLGPGEGGGTGGGAYRPGNGVELPRVVREVRPQYTADAMRAKVQGTVLIECVVLPDGTVGEISVTKSLDSVFGLDQEAIKAAKQWRFIPGRRFGQPVPVLVTIELTFTLR